MTISSTNIDDTKPVEGTPTTESVRDNFTEIKTQFDNAETDISTHIADTANPHSVTPEQLGLEIGTDVQAYDATYLVDADIGVNVQAYSADLTRIDTAIDAAAVDAKCLTFDANEDAQFVGTAQFAAGEGVVFNGDAIAAVNTLDDYEEGTWTPNEGTGLTVVGSFSPSGTYIKIGNLVTVHAYFAGSTSIACSGNGQICSNIPFTPVSGENTGSLINDPRNASQVVSAITTGAIHSSAAITAVTGFTLDITYIV